MKLWRLINYFDVWGNKKDGYEVNNLCEECVVELLDQVDDRYLLQKLKEVNFLRREIRVNQVTFTDWGDLIEIEERRSGKPIGRLEPVL